MGPLLSTIACILLVSVAGLRAAGWDSITNSLLATFDTFDILALGEWHGSEQDSDLRLQLIRHSDFPRKVRYIVIETGNARHQTILDRFIAGEDVPPEEIRKVWRDITTPGGADAPMYEALLHEIRRLNRTLPASLRLRVLAADPPIDWNRINSRSEWREIAGSRDVYAAELMEREVIRKGGKALLICGAGHLWQNNQLVREPNIATLLKQRHPGKLYTVSRMNPSEEFRNKLNQTDLPILLPLGSHIAGGLSANELLGLPVRMFADDTKLREVIDAVVYTGRKDPTPAVTAAAPADPVYEAERLRRQKLLQPR